MAPDLKEGINMRRTDLDLIFASSRRAFRTAMHVILALSIIGGFNFSYILYIAFVVALVTILTSIVLGVPEAVSDGALLIDRSGVDKDIYRLALDKNPEEYIRKRNLTLRINANTRLER
jgi:hypothetical protein